MAFTAGNQPLAGYPQPVGAKIEKVFDHTGPSSYTQFATPTTGGDVINASDLGIGGIESMAPVVDTTGKVIAYPVFNYGGYGNAVPSVAIQYWSLVTASLYGQSQVLGTQVVAASDLSGLSFRFRALCV
jgi:hypothetical protein